MSEMETESAMFAVIKLMSKEMKEEIEKSRLEQGYEHGPGPIHLKQCNFIDVLFAISCKDNVKAFVFVVKTIGINDFVKLFDEFFGLNCLMFHSAYRIFEVASVIGCDWTNSEFHCKSYEEMIKWLSFLVFSDIHLPHKMICPGIMGDIGPLYQAMSRCKSVIVTLLALKKRHIPALVRLDRFLIKQELAMAVWTTRSDEKWRNTT